MNEDFAEDDFAENMRLDNSLGDLERETFIEIHNSGLPSDYFNEWAAFDMFGKDDLIHLQRVPSFKEYVESKVKTKTWKPKFGDFVLKNCRPEKVNKVDDLAAEFNADIMRIQAEKDLRKLQDFYRRSMEIKND